MDESDYGFVAVEHDWFERHIGKSVADRPSELFVAEGFDDAGPRYDVTHGVDGEPCSDESGTGFQL